MRISIRVQLVACVNMASDLMTGRKLIIEKWLRSLSLAINFKEQALSSINLFSQCANLITYSCLSTPPINMKIASPFLELIPTCKRQMRRLRKKIYKFLTSKNCPRRAPSSTDLHALLRKRSLPEVVLEALSKKKDCNLAVLRTLCIEEGVGIEEMVKMAGRQEAAVLRQQEDWVEYTAIKKQLLGDEEDSRIKEMESRRTLSSTEMEGEIGGETPCSEYLQLGDPFPSKFEESAQIQQSDVRLIMRGSGFLQLESSIFSQENLFRGQEQAA